MARKRIWRKSLHRTETWKGKRIKVTRNKKGRFVTWHKIRKYTRGARARRRWKAEVASSRWRTEVRRRARFRPTGFGGKKIAVWRGNQRVQMVGSGRQLKSAMRLVIRHPPKKRFLTLSAEALLDDPSAYLDMKHEWSARPNVESR